MFIVLYAAVIPLNFSVGIDVSVISIILYLDCIDYTGIALRLVTVNLDKNC